jgi:hypothetical protein
MSDLGPFSAPNRTLTFIGSRQADNVEGLANFVLASTLGDGEIVFLFKDNHGVSSLKTSVVLAGTSARRMAREQSSRLPNAIPRLRTNAVRMAIRGVQPLIPDREPRLRTNALRMTERGVHLVRSDREPRLRTNALRMAEVGI